MSVQDPTFEEVWGPDPGDDPLLVFGPIVGVHEVEEAVLSVLRRWERTYTYEVARRAGFAPDALPHIKAWRVSSETENYYEDHHPAVVVKGLAGRVIRRGGGSSSHQQTWRWEIEVITQSVTRSTRSPKDSAIPQPRRVAMIYCTAFRTILVQQRDEGKLLGMIDVLGERYTSTPAHAERSVHLASVLATVEVPRVAEWGRGPAAPMFPPVNPADPPPATEPQWPTASEVDTKIQKVPLEESLSDDHPGDELPQPRR